MARGIWWRVERHWKAALRLVGLCRTAFHGGVAFGGVCSYRAVPSNTCPSGRATRVGGRSHAFIRASRGLPLVESVFLATIGSANRRGVYHHEVIARRVARPEDWGFLTELFLS